MALTRALAEVRSGMLDIAPQSAMKADDVCAWLSDAVEAMTVQRATNVRLAEQIEAMTPAGARKVEEDLRARIEWFEDAHERMRRDLSVARESREGAIYRIRTLESQVEVLEERLRAARHDLALSRAGRAMTSLIEETKSLREQNACMRAQLELADRGERLRNKREDERTKAAAPIATLEGVTYGSPAVRSKATLAEGAYWQMAARLLV